MPVRISSLNRSSSSRGFDGPEMPLSPGMCLLKRRQIRERREAGFEGWCWLEAEEAVFDADGDRTEEAPSEVE